MPGAVLMERAGTAPPRPCWSAFRTCAKHGVVVVAGKGNNGGDGFVVARALKRRRVRVDVVLAAAPSEVRGDARDEAAGVAARRRPRPAVTSADLGALARALDEPASSSTRSSAPASSGDGHGRRRAEVIALVNASGAADRWRSTCRPGSTPTAACRSAPASRPSSPSTFGFPKIGIMIHPGRALRGEVAVVDIGIPDEARRRGRDRASPPSTSREAAALAARRATRDAHKGSSRPPRADRRLARQDGRRDPRGARPRRAPARGSSPSAARRRAADRRRRAARGDDVAAARRRRRRPRVRRRREAYRALLADKRAVGSDRASARSDRAGAGALARHGRAAADGARRRRAQLPRRARPRPTPRARRGTARADAASRRDGAARRAARPPTVQADRIGAARAPRGDAPARWSC